MAHVCGTVTALLSLSAAVPGAAGAQARGSMQVLANVTSAQPAWDGLTTAQRVAADFRVARTPGSSGGSSGVIRRVELTLARVEIADGGPDDEGQSVRPTIWIEFLHN